MLIDDFESVVVSQEQISERTKELGKSLSKQYAGKNPLFVGILKGSFVFMADLVRSVDIDCTMDFMSVSSYGNGTVSSGELKIKKDLSENIEGRHVIIVEDILDSGVTLGNLLELLKQRNPASLEIVTLLDKPSGRKVNVEPMMRGFVIPGGFVAGYGLDYAEKYRNLPFVGILKPEVYSK